MNHFGLPVKIRPSDAALMVGSAVLCGPPPDGKFKVRLEQMIEIAAALNEIDGLRAQRDALAGACEPFAYMAAAVSRMDWPDWRARGLQQAILSASLPPSPWCAGRINDRATRRI
jgi:hypothetical protein